ncbi:MAG: methylmalonyl-CoA mutase [Candidatus Eisenbacteria bacterium]|nr:methylmalonyl-CoA mutase [Candidatus Eisenbacteria bacterium]
MTSDAHRHWQEIYAKQKTRKPKFPTSSFEPEPLYTSGDLPQWQEERDLGYPGEFPFVRGIQPSQYRGRLWTMRQYAGFGSAEETNARFRFLLEQGQTGLSTAFDLPTQMGYDSTDPIALGEVGKVGVAIDTLADMELLLKDLPLGKVSTSMTINATASILLLMYQIVAERQGVAKEDISGTIQNDVLKEYEARGTFIFPPGPSLRITADIIAYCADALPSWNTISISGYHIREAGSTAVQELAFTFSNAIAYVEAVRERGLDIDAFAPRLSFFFNAHNHFFEEVAKFRAARRIWANLMRYRFGAKDPKSWMLRFHTQTAGSTLQAQQIDVNVVRIAYQAMAAVLGGTQSLHTNSRDEALSLPSNASALLALRTQQVLAEETGAADVIDPLGGSYYIEALTDRLETEALALMKRVEEQGGVLKSIETGFIQREIHHAAYQAQQAIEHGEQKIVGVNCYQIEETTHPPVFHVNEAVARGQSDRLARIKAERSSVDVERHLDTLEQAARGTDNLMPHLKRAIESYASIGEICARLRKVYGAYRDPGYL